jgi:hypothetical protein
MYACQFQALCAAHAFSCPSLNGSTKAPISGSFEQLIGLQSPGVHVRPFNRGCILRRCVQLSKLQALLLHLLSAEDHPSLPDPPLSVSAKSSSQSAKRTKVMYWGGVDCAADGSGDELDDSALHISRSQQRAVKAYKCALCLMYPCFGSNLWTLGLFAKWVPACFWKIFTTLSGEWKLLESPGQCPVLPCIRVHLFSAPTASSAPSSDCQLTGSHRSCNTVSHLQ